MKKKPEENNNINIGFAFAKARKVFCFECCHLWLLLLFVGFVFGVFGLFLLCEHFCGTLVGQMVRVA